MGRNSNVLHDHGNEENFFDRVDFKPSPADTLNVNLGFTRSWFQTPNSYDAQDATAWSGLVVDNNGLGPNGLPVGPTDQRSQIRTFNVAPTWTRVAECEHGVHPRRLSCGRINTTTIRATILSPTCNPICSSRPSARTAR
jgi:hypothetical protein